MWWKKNNGMIVAELLLSLSVFLMIGFFFIPLLMDLSGQTRKLQIENQSYRLLYDELQAFVIDEQPSPDHTSIINGIEYQIFWRDPNLAEQKEVCVKVEKNFFQSETNICLSSE